MTKQFNVMLTPQEYQRLGDMATLSHCPKGQVIRAALHALYAMQVQDIPTCATGRQCAAPQLHPRRQTAA